MPGDVQDPQRQPSLLILGENSAGKSSILDAIALALSQPSERKALGLDSRCLMLNEEFLGGRPGALRPATVSITFDDNETYNFKAQLKGMSSDARLPDLPVFAYGAFPQYLTGMPAVALSVQAKPSNSSRIDTALKNARLAGLMDIPFPYLVF